MRKGQDMRKGVRLIKVIHSQLGQPVKINSLPSGFELETSQCSIYILESLD
jgi:hypothetical protein